MQNVKNTCFAIKNNISLLMAHIAAKFRDDLLIELNIVIKSFQNAIHRKLPF